MDVLIHPRVQFAFDAPLTRLLLNDLNVFRFSPWIG